MQILERFCLVEVADSPVDEVSGLRRKAGKFGATSGGNSLYPSRHEVLKLNSP